MGWKYNPFTEKLDRTATTEETEDFFVLKAGDTMTGKLTITPASGETSLDAQKDIVLKQGRHHGKTPSSGRLLSLSSNLLLGSSK